MLKYESSVDMTYEDCSKAVSRVINKLGRIEFDIDLLNKKVCINSEQCEHCWRPWEETLRALSYWGSK